MCQPITCPDCGRPSWVGCGAHVEDVLGHVPAEERCPGHEFETGAAGAPAAN